MKSIDRDHAKYKTNYIKELDGLRGLAILLVMASHTNFLHLSGQGGVGVWIFFVLSGYLLAIPFVNNISNITNKKNVYNYYIRRLKRIIPMYYITVLLYLIFNPNFIGGKIQIVKHLTFLQANGHFWSTQQEMCFYLVLPIIFYLVFLINRIFHASKAIISVVLFIVGVILYKILPANVFYLIGNGVHQRFCISIFLFGIATCFFVHSDVLNKYKNKIFYITLDVISILILILFFITAKYYKELFGVFENVNYFSWEYPLFFALMSSILILNLIINTEGIIARLFSIKPIRYIGKISYSMYLLHYFLLGFIDTRIANDNLLFLVLFSITLIISTITYYVIELPLMNSRFGIFNYTKKK
jgi:peptidoglycan/LPS O-acetylase OafA/YrhL